MALFNNPDGEEQPQKNQYLQSNPNTDNNANTSWMSPSSTGEKTSGNIAQSQSNPPSQVQNGTMLGNIASGNSSQGGMPSFGMQAPNHDQLRQYAQSRGGNAFTDSSLGYWSNPQKWNELTQRGQQLQPGSDGSWYANKFLSNAEEFTGGPQQTAMNMWGTSGEPQALSGSANGGQGLWAMLQSLMGQKQNQGAQPYDQYQKNPNPGMMGNQSQNSGINPGPYGSPVPTSAGSLMGSGLVAPSDNSNQGGSMLGMNNNRSQGLLDPSRFGGIQDSRYQY